MSSRKNSKARQSCFDPSPPFLHQLDARAGRSTIEAMSKLRRHLLGVVLAGMAAATFSCSGSGESGTVAGAGDCHGCDCLAPEVCGDSEAVCPAGEDCWMPEVCPDETVVCPPADPKLVPQ